VSVHLVTGDDETLVASAVLELVDALVGDSDRSLMVDSFDGDDYELRAVVDAAQTAPFLTERRVVVARGIGRFTADEVGPLIAYLTDPLDTTDLVLVGGGGRIVKSVLDATKSARASVVDTTPPSNRNERLRWIEHAAEHERLRFDAAASALVAEWLGEDPGQLGSLLDTLYGAFGAGRTLRADDVRPFLADAGDVRPWDLTDAIDRGDTAGAVTALRRMMGAGERHPLVVMAILHTHYTRMLRLDGADVANSNEAAALLNLKTPFQAEKAMKQVRRIGSGGVRRAIELLARADLDLRGARDWPPELVMEVLVARLSRLGATSATAGRPLRRR
jgi:DNA polymerase-3 subunit delta